MRIFGQQVRFRMHEQWLAGSIEYTLYHQGVEEASRRIHGVNSSMYHLTVLIHGTKLLLLPLWAEDLRLKR